MKILSHVFNVMKILFKVNNKDTRGTSFNVVLMSLLLTLNTSNTFLWTLMNRYFEQVFRIENVLSIKVSSVLKKLLQSDYQISTLVIQSFFKGFTTK